MRYQVLVTRERGPPYADSFATEVVMGDRHLQKRGQMMARLERSRQQEAEAKARVQAMVDAWFCPHCGRMMLEFGPDSSLCPEHPEELLGEA